MTAIEDFTATLNQLNDNGFAATWKQELAEELLEKWTTLNKQVYGKDIYRTTLANPVDDEELVVCRIYDYYYREPANCSIYKS